MSVCGDVAALLFLMASCLSGSSEGLMEMKDVECYSNVSLPCEAGQLGPKFRSLTWYKNRSGILRRIWNETKENENKLYNYTRQAALGPEGQLMLPRVTPNDTGTYECLLRANLGGHNLESSVYLSVNGTCVEPVTSTPSSWTAQVDPVPDVLEVHAGWAALCFLSLNLLKVIICVVAIKLLAKMSPSQSYRVGGSQRVTEVTEMRPNTSTSGLSREARNC